MPSIVESQTRIACWSNVVPERHIESTVAAAVDFYKRYLDAAMREIAKVA